MFHPHFYFLCLQLLFVVAMDAVAEELFFRIAIQVSILLISVRIPSTCLLFRVSLEVLHYWQGGLAHMFLSDGKISVPSDGIAALVCWIHLGVPTIYLFQ